MARSENALRKFKTAHAEGIAATKAEFVKFLREGELPEESLDMVALDIYLGNRVMLQHDPKRTPVPAGNFFAAIVEDGVYDTIERLDNPRKYAALEICPECDGEGEVPKRTGIVESNVEMPEPKRRTAKPRQTELR